MTLIDQAKNILYHMMCDVAVSKDVTGLDLKNLVDQFFKDSKITQLFQLKEELEKTVKNVAVDIEAPEDCYVVAKKVIELLKTNLA